MLRGDQRGHRAQTLLPLGCGDGAHGGGLPGGGQPGERLRPLHQVYHVRLSGVGGGAAWCFAQHVM